VHRPVSKFKIRQKRTFSTDHRWCGVQFTINLLSLSLSLYDDALMNLFENKTKNLYNKAGKDFSQRLYYYYGCIYISAFSICLSFLCVWATYVRQQGDVFLCGVHMCISYIASNNKAKVSKLCGLYSKNRRNKNTSNTRLPLFHSCNALAIWRIRRAHAIHSSGTFEASNRFRDRSISRYKSVSLKRRIISISSLS
jgi:hypothetical protein